ncbi:hypothetical protein C1752_01733 [Acaryochloris thomasi RCC1774]|uniref:Uncharacterized protein n=1 Tax=Acaryochloris thomasi RCC1774 TaxID=1764569 RepID=A0A2W1JWK0_9CYAN|nr:hypothetical protein [Acaryochloris thomasi]PZD74054.1 hypothetical protein C1752_01733 [Acaryochloris thomasi RCC1774]
MNRSYLLGGLGASVALVWVCPSASALSSQATGAIADFQAAASVAHQRKQLSPYLTEKYML